MRTNPKIVSFYLDEEAQGLVEYSLILSLVALVVLGSLIIFGETVLNLYDSIKGEVEKI